MCLNPSLIVLELEAEALGRVSVVVELCKPASIAGPIVDKTVAGGLEPGRARVWQLHSFETVSPI